MSENSKSQKTLQKGRKTLNTFRIWAKNFAEFFDAGKSFVLGEVLFHVIILAAASIGGLFFSRWMESIRYQKPNTFAVVLTLFCVGVLFGFVVLVFLKIENP